MNWLVLESLLPVILLIAAGFGAGKRGWVREGSIKDLLDLVFLLFSPALLFRTMSQVRLETLDFAPVAAYFMAVGVLFFATLWVVGFGRRGVVMGLASTFSNTVMIGIAVVNLVFGAQGLVIMLTLVSVHALVLLTLATLVLELAVQREQARSEGLIGQLRTAVRVLGATLMHPVTMPILAGLAYAQTGWGIHPWLDKPLGLLAQAFSPVALVLVGVTLAFTSVGPHWRGALGLALLKNLVHPLLVWLLCLVLGVDGLPMTVMVLAAALPIGSNVFLFSQRYGVAQELVTASVFVSTVLALFTLTALLMVLT